MDYLHLDHDMSNIDPNASIPLEIRMLQLAEKLVCIKAPLITEWQSRPDVFNTGFHAGLYRAAAEIMFELKASGLPLK